jgi:hypothetical protein
MEAVLVLIRGTAGDGEAGAGMADHRAGVATPLVAFIAS